MTVGLTMLLAPESGAQAWKDSLRAGITQAITLTRTTRSYGSVVAAGTTLSAAVPGIDVSPEEARNNVSTKIHDGAVRAPRGLSKFLVRTSHRDLKLGERVYVTDVKIRDDAVTLFLAATESERISIDGTTRDVRFMGVVDFEFDKAGMSTLTADSVVHVVYKILKPADAATAEAAAPKATPVSLALGQTTEEVERALGKPESVVTLGSKTIYVYKALKVTLVDGKVVDVQ